jgi:alpha-glucosidase (family GH31 glycosyl hydrolase)
LHQPFERQGVDFWWLDWCCERPSQVTMPGLTPDAWVNHLHADDLARRNLRGFVLSRIGASWQDWSGAYPSGAWADHRDAVHFTGDTWSTWNTLAFESAMTAREGNAGLPYVSHDIGG